MYAHYYPRIIPKDLLETNVAGIYIDLHQNLSIPVRTDSHLARTNQFRERNYFYNNMFREGSFSQKDSDKLLQVIKYELKTSTVTTVR